MNYKIVPTQAFLRESKLLSKRYSSVLEDIDLLGNSLSENPKQGDPIVKNCYKVRMAIRSKNKGKSGGARVITHLLIKPDGETLYLLKILI